jgi:DNA-binding transcriptional LysR family regulator
MINNIDWDKLKKFYFIAKAGGFSQASSYLNLAQSTLSRTIQGLESELGFPVFVRHRSGTLLTEEGSILFKAASKMFADLENTIDDVELVRKEPLGSLKIVVSGGLLHFYMLPYIPNFLATYPKIKLTIIAADSVPTLELLEADVILRPKVEDRDDYIQRLLLTNRVQLYASRKYLDQFGTPQKSEDLDNHRLIGFGYHKDAESFQAMNWHLALGKQQGGIRSPYIEVNTPQARLELAKADLGITCIAAEHAGLSDSNLVQVLPDIEGPTVSSYFIYSKTHQNSMKIKVLEEYLLNAFARDFGKN